MDLILTYDGHVIINTVLGGKSQVLKIPSWKANISYLDYWNVIQENAYVNNPKYFEGSVLVAYDVQTTTSPIKHTVVNNCVINDNLYLYQEGDWYLWSRTPNNRFQEGSSSRFAYSGIVKFTDYQIPVQNEFLYFYYSNNEWKDKFTISYPELNKAGYFVYGPIENYENYRKLSSSNIGVLGNINPNYDSNKKILQEISDSILPAPPDGDPNPYQPGGETEPDIESPGGEWELPEYIPPDTPSPINDLDLGLFRAYAMTDSQLTQFSRQLWSKDILQQLRNLVVSPLDVVIQLLSLPFEPEASSSATNITFNWLDGWMPGESAATGYRLTTEYKEISFVGRSDINRYSGLFYDYLPYTRCHLFIPYIGFIEVKANEFIKAHSLTLKYNVNQLTGEFTVFVKTSAMPYQLGQYQGQMGRPLPLSMANYIPLVSSTIQAAAYGTAAIVGGGAMIGSLASNMASRFNPLGLSENKNIVNPKNPLSNSASALNAVLNANIPIQRNGSFGPVTGRTSTQVPFLVFSIPHQNISSQQKILGYSSNLSGPLVNYNGVTKVRDIQLAIPSATLTEINELQSILEGGIEI